MSEHFMRKPCKNCPFRKDVRPFLTPERGEELAYLTENPYNSFSCHATIESDDEGETYATSDSKQCAGFLTMVAQANGENHVPEGFEPSYGLCYEESMEMIDVYENPEEFFDAES